MSKVTLQNGDTAVLISPTQLKVANLIFNEHLQLKVTDSLLNEQLIRYKNLYKDELEIDSTYEATIGHLKTTIIDYEAINEEQTKHLDKVKTKLKCWRASSITSLAVLLLICLL